MKSNKTAARIIGILFITATVAGILSAAFSGPIHGSDFLIEVSRSESNVIFASLFSLIMAVAVAGIAIAAYPVLKRQSEILALGYVGARIFEAVLFIATVVGWLLLVELSKEYVAAGAPDTAYFQTVGGLLRAIGDRVGHVVLDVVIAPLHYLIFYSLLYRSKLVPRWLSIWGLIGIPMWFVAGLLALSGSDPTSAIPVILNIPIALNEMVLAVWLIVKGFNASALAPVPGADRGN
jgi:hypothetical protein